MNINMYTNKVTEALQSAQSLAIASQHSQITLGHLLKSLLEQGGFFHSLLSHLNLDISEVEEKVDTFLKKLPQIEGNAEVYPEKPFIKAFSEAEREAKNMSDEFVSLEHVFIGMVNQKNHDLIQEVFSQKNIDKKSILDIIDKIRQGRKVGSKTQEDSYEALKKYTINLTQLAREGKLDPVIGRDEEIRRTMQILSRKTKNNPVLVGEPGVGKTAIAEGLARRIIKGDVPDSLQDKKLLSLDLGSLIAGAKFQGEFEERLKSVIQEIEKSDGEIILFIDEMHMIVGAGRTQGAMDAGNLLKPALARGLLHAIGATTLKEYRQYIEKDAALERRFQPIQVTEPSVEDTISILRGLKETYEVHHGVRILDEAITAASELSNRYITDRFLPDKALDLLDEATSSLRMEIESKPTSLDTLEREKMRLEIEKEAIAKDIKEKPDDQSANDKLETIKQNIKKLTDEISDIESVWQKEKTLIHNISEKKALIEQEKNNAERYKDEGDYQKAAEIEYGKIPTLTQEIEKAKKELEKIQSKNSYLSQEVTKQDIAKVVAKWTGIPVTKMLQSETEKLLSLEKELSKRVIGQKEAIETLSSAVRRNRAGLNDPNKPIGSFIFLGPTGVGKTELSKTLAKFLFNSDKALIRFDMSEYMEKHAVAKLIGSPPGYVGYEEGGQLTEIVRRRPYCVLLFDEIEKAHPDVFNIFLQILDDGRLTDSKGRVVDFTNTIIIMTSNIGSNIINESREKKTNNLKDQLLEELKKHFRMEFINRLDDTVIFHFLSPKEIRKIVDIQLADITQRLAEKGISITLSDKTKDLLGERGFDQAFGARPLKRLIQRDIVDKLSLLILEGKGKNEIQVDVKDGEIVFE